MYKEAIQKLADANASVDAIIKQPLPGGKSLSPIQIEDLPNYVGQKVYFDGKEFTLTACKVVNGFDKVELKEGDRRATDYYLFDIKARGGLHLNTNDSKLAIGLSRMRATTEEFIKASEALTKHFTALDQITSLPDEA